MHGSESFQSPESVLFIGWRKRKTGGVDKGMALSVVVVVINCQTPGCVGDSYSGTESCQNRSNLLKKPSILDIISQKMQKEGFYGIG